MVIKKFENDVGWLKMYIKRSWGLRAKVYYVIKGNAMGRKTYVEFITRQEAEDVFIGLRKATEHMSRLKKEGRI